MSDIEKTWLDSPARRKALMSLATFMAASPLAAMAQPDPVGRVSKLQRVAGLSEMRTAFDFYPLFEGNLPTSVTEYTAHGDGSEFNIERNRQAFDWIDVVRSRPAIPASQVDLSSDILGVKTKFPILCAPTSGQNGIHPEGQNGMFKGATAASKMIDILASGNGAAVEAALKAVPGGIMWSQFYPTQDLANTQRIIAAGEDAGSGALVVTCDQTAPYYERDLIVHNLGGRGVLAGGAGFGTFVRPAEGAVARGASRYGLSEGRLWYSWEYIDAVRKATKGKMLVKGIISPQDARLAIEHGADGIIVSNHGGRSMDYGPSTIEILPQVVAAVNGRVPVLIDSGFRRGSDVFKALALGANGVCLGKAARWGLGAFGAAGAQRVFEIIQQELIETAAAAGCAKLSDINRSTVRTSFV